jgi:hypothetical protein
LADPAFHPGDRVRVCRCDVLDGLIHEYELAT